MPLPSLMIKKTRWEPKGDNIMERTTKARKLGKEFMDIMYSGKFGLFGGYPVDITEKNLYWSDTNSKFSRELFNLRIKFVDACKSLGVEKEQGTLIDVTDPRTMAFNLCKVYEKIKDRVDFPNPFEPLKQLYEMNCVPIGVVGRMFLIKVR